MIKKFLSLVTLSATLVSPAFADDFVPFQYYKAEPLNNYLQYEVRAMSISSGSELSSIRAGIASAITYAVSQAGTKNFKGALEEVRTRASMGANLADNVIDCIICTLCSNEDNPNRAKEKALAILDEAIDKEKEKDYNSYGYSNGSSAIGMPPDDDKYKKPISGTGKEKATDIPIWAKGERPYAGENGKNYAIRLMNKRYGKGNWENNANRMREFRQIQKNGDRGYK